MYFYKVSEKIWLSPQTIRYFWDSAKFFIKIKTTWTGPMIFLDLELTSSLFFGFALGSEFPPLDRHLCTYDTGGLYQNKHKQLTFLLCGTKELVFINWSFSIEYENAFLKLQKNTALYQRFLFQNLSMLKCIVLHGFMQPLLNEFFFFFYRCRDFA